MKFILAENGFQGFIARAEDVSGEKGPLAEFEVLGLQAVDFGAQRILRGAALRAKLVTNRFDFLERKEKIEFLSEDGVFEPAKAKEGLLAQTLDGDDLPAKSSCHDLCPWKKLC